MVEVVTGKPFGLALCEHLGLDAESVSNEIRVHNGVNEVFGVSLRIALTAKDVEAIGKLMAGKQQR